MLRYYHTYIIKSSETMSTNLQLEGTLVDSSSDRCLFDTYTSLGRTLEHS